VSMESEVTYPSLKGSSDTPNSAEDYLRSGLRKADNGFESVLLEE